MKSLVRKLDIGEWHISNNFEGDQDILEEVYDVVKENIVTLTISGELRTGLFFENLKSL